MSLRSAVGCGAVVVMAGALVAGCGTGGGGNALPSAADIGQMSCHQLAGIHPNLPSAQDLTKLTDASTLQSDMDSANAYLQRLLALGGCPNEPGLGGAQLPNLVPATNQQ